MYKRLQEEQAGGEYQGRGWVLLPQAGLPEGTEAETRRWRCSQTLNWGKRRRQWKQQVQRPQGEHKLGACEDQGGGQWGCSPVRGREVAQGWRSRWRCSLVRSLILIPILFIKFIFIYLFGCIGS